MRVSDSNRLLEIYDEMNDSLSISVKIDWRQARKVALTDLIGKRNDASDELKECFDKIIKAYYLSESEFEKYVLQGEELE